MWIVSFGWRIVIGLQSFIACLSSYLFVDQTRSSLRALGATRDVGTKVGPSSSSRLAHRISSMYAFASPTAVRYAS